MPPPAEGTPRIVELLSGRLRDEGKHPEISDRRPTRFRVTLEHRNGHSRTHRMDGMGQPHDPSPDNREIDLLHPKATAPPNMVLL